MMKAGTMPLPVDAVTLPLYVYERWEGKPIDLVGQWERWLPWARGGTLAFWWLLLFYGWRTGHLLGGPWGGRLAVALLACEPTLLAHASLATTDVAVSACLLAFAYHFRTGRGEKTFRRVVIPAFWFGVTVLAKASGLVFCPLCMLALEAERLWREGLFQRGWQEWHQAVRRWWRDVVPIGLGGLTLVMVYCGSDWQREPTFVRWAAGLPEGKSREVLCWLADHLRIFSNGGEGLIQQIKHNIRGHGAYLLGHSAPRALWYYFPVLTTIKLSTTVLLAVMMVLVLRRQELTNWACVAAALLATFSLTYRVQLGIRMILPLVVLGMVGLAVALARTWQAYRYDWRASIVASGLSAGILWTCITAARVWPDGLSYINDFFAGFDGYRLVSETNYDWGQGLEDLAEWQRAQRLADLEIWYYGTDPMIGSISMRPLPLQEIAAKGNEAMLHQLRGHYLAASTTIVYGPPLNEGQQKAATLLQQYKPVARTKTFLIYDFTREQRPVAWGERPADDAGK